jgi:hypothetical protein
MRIILRRSRATIVAPRDCVPFGTPSADRCHVRIRTVRVGLIERGA